MVMQGCGLPTHGSVFDASGHTDIGIAAIGP